MSEKPKTLTHLDSAGHAYMVDVSEKDVTLRRAWAEGYVTCLPRTTSRILEGDTPKGDVLAVARIAGVAGAKKTPDLLPLAHVIGVHGCQVELQVDPGRISIEAQVSATDRTGVEMEALTAVTVAALALVDMLKGIDRSTAIEDCRVVRKEGGRSGTWVRAK